MPRVFKGEDAIQARVMALLRMHGVTAFHCPNETIGGDAYRSKRWAMGVESGVPDILIIDPPPSMPAFVGAALELKDGRKKATPDQLRWLAMLHARRWLVAIERTEQAALTRLVWWGYLPASVLDSVACPPAASSIKSSTARSSAPTRARSSSTRRRSRSS